MSADDCDSPEPSAFVRGFGIQIRTLRRFHKLSREELGDRAGFAASTIGAFERADRIVDAKGAQALDVALGANGVLASVSDQLEEERYPRKFARFFGLERDAVSLSTYDTQVINGLLQTEAYARAVFRARVPYRDADEIEVLVAERLERQALLRRKPMAVLCFIVEEAVLRRRVGGRQVMREQLRHLLDLGRLPHIQVLVMPLDCEEAVGASGPMTLLETPEHRMLGYFEVQGLGTLVSAKDEVSTWMHRYGMIQVNALRPADSVCMIERLMEEL